MRIALISAYNDRCYGLRSVASYLRQQGHEVWLICFKRYESVILAPEDREAWACAMSSKYPPVTESHEEGTMFCPYIHPASEREWELLVGKLCEIRPDLIGMSVFAASYDASKQLTEQIRRALPGVPVVWGGVHATTCPEECLETADMVCIGEGEYSMANLAANPERADIAGLWLHHNGQIVRNPIHPLEQNLDLFPFASYGENEWLVEDDRLTEKTLADQFYSRVMYICMSSRGCPFRCTYCAHHLLRPMYSGQRYVRRRSVDHFLDEVAQRVRELNFESLVFWDDVFVMNRKWIAEFCEKYPRRIGLPFGAYAHPSVSTDEMFRQLKAGGMVFVGLGVQTGSDYISREIYGRNYGSEALIELARMAEKNGLTLAYDLLSNNPYESEADCLETLRLIGRLPKGVSLTVKKVVFFPGTTIGALDKPKHNLPDTTHEFWNQLYLIARHHVIPQEALEELGRDEYLKANPEIVRALALGLKRAIEARDASRQEMERLMAADRDVTLRGFLRYIKRMTNRGQSPFSAVQ
ncbi:B12-binding domain-containing radical SAM protein [Candidatus Sumerlaeota bacterium]|nr:B12-binding domain-containing radical SAM protein [Candidatus Sumerlaeota bacterium]